MKLVGNLPKTLKESKIILIATKECWKKQLPLNFLGELGLDPTYLGKKLSDVKPGETGRSFDSLVGTKVSATKADFKEVQCIILPDKVSRHVSPVCKDAIYNLSSGIESGKSALVVLFTGYGSLTYESSVAAIARRIRGYSKKSGYKPAKVRMIAIDNQSKIIKPGLTSKALSIAISQCCSLVDTPANELNCDEFTSELKVLASSLPHTRFKLIKGKSQLLSKGLGGIYGVGMAAHHEPRLAILEYTPEGSQKSPGATYALVGKGVVYDTGGIKLKPDSGEMKSDMGGAAAVTGAFRVLAETGFSKRLILAIPLVENAINERALRNDDIITMHSGLTVEVNNTDAEGRLILADACSYVDKTYHPEIMIDAATLTGAQLITSGRFYGSIVTNDQGLEDHLVACGLQTGDMVHALPFAPEILLKEFESQVADLRNSVADRMNAQSACAGLFIYKHIEQTKARWAHLDLAGPAFSKERLGTGYGVQILAAALSSWDD